MHCFDRFLNLLDAWWQELTNYFIQRENSAFVEGFNNKVKVLKHRCYGIFNLKHLFLRSILTCMAIAYLLPPPFMAESRQFPESHLFYFVNNSIVATAVVLQIYKCLLL